MKTLAVIGSTGSIGKSSLNVYLKNKKKFKLLFLSTYSNHQEIDRQFKKFRPRYYNILLKEKINLLKYKKKIIDLNFFLKNKIKIDYVVSGLGSFDALKYNFELLKISKNLLIANKETLICGGKIFLNKAKKYNCKILPIDSEHHCIDYFIKNFDCKNSLKKITILASGGPFFKKKPKFKESIKNVLNHPNWKMGKIITVNSSTMANKVLELFEAKILFNLPNKKIDIKIEKKSLVHAIITLKNNINFLIAHTPNMEIPISNCLGLDNKYSFSNYLNSEKIKIDSLDVKNYSIVKIGYKVLEYGHASMIIFTVLNERLVKLFLNSKIFYGDISLKLEKLFKNKEIVNISKKCIKSKSDIYNLINYSQNIKIK